MRGSSAPAMTAGEAIVAVPAAGRIAGSEAEFRLGPAYVPAVDGPSDHFYGAWADPTDPSDPMAGMDGSNLPRNGRDRPGLASRRLLVLPGVFILIVAALPWVAMWLQGRWSGGAPDITVITSSAITLVLGWWILNLLAREQRYTVRHLRELERLTLTDPLTGLGNRRALERDLPIALSRASRLDQPLALLFMDVDHMKQLNDRHGHAAGDETLRAMGAVLRSNSRLGTDVAYRVGGDEFVMSVVTDPEGAESLGERIRREFQARTTHHSSLSLGVVAWDGRAGAAELLDRADTRMYQSKSVWTRRAPQAGLIQLI